MIGVVSSVCFCAAAAIDDETSGTARQICVIRDPLLPEVSGLAVSRTMKNAVWMHNDSGDLARLFLVDFNGTTRGIVKVSGVTATDWEDMCSFELDGESWLLVGDIGDNARVRSRARPSGERRSIIPPVQSEKGGRPAAPVCRLLLLREPEFDFAGQADTVSESTVPVVRTIEFQFPEGPQDCESLAVDPVSRTILLVTKTNPFSSALYSLPLKLTKGRESLTAEKIAAVGATFATAMDVSPDGRRLVIVNMFGGVMLARDNPENDSWADACGKPVTVLTLPKRKQGESVCFTADGNSLLLNSEGLSQPLWQLDLESISRKD